MSGDKPWMRPCIYNDDRFVEQTKEEGPQPFPHHDLHADDPFERNGRDIEEILSRRERREEKEYECTDTTPINYKKGPHDQEFGVDEKEFDQADDAPVPYGNGAHDDEFGVEDEEELEPLDDEPEFDED